MTVSEIVQRLDAKKNGDHWKARCPSHEDKTPSLSIKEGNDGRVLLRCFAGCSIEDITAAMNIKTKDLFSEPMTPGRFTTEAMHVFNATPVTDLSGQADRNQAVAAVLSGCDTSKSPAQFSPLTPAGIKQLSEWRGYSEEFVKALSDKGAIGTVKVKDGNAVAFPVTNGWHYRKKDGSWRFTEGAKPDLFVLGTLEEGAVIHCFESQWCALSFSESSGEVDNIAATRGAGNVKLLTDRLNGHSGTLVLWPQHDKPGQKWAQDIREAMPDQQITLAAIPANMTLSGSHGGEIKETVIPVKDLNAWIFQGATDGDVFNAALDAKDFNNVTDFPVPVLAEPDAPQSSHSVAGKTEGESREATDSPSNTNPNGTRGGGNNSASTQTGVDYKLAPSSPASKVSGGDAESSSVSTQTRAPVEITERPDSGCQAEASEAIRPDILGEKSSPETRVQSGGATVGGSYAPLAQTLDDTVAFARRYIFFPEEGQAEVFALWAIHTYCFDRFSVTPYIHLWSPEQNCGKSTALDCLSVLVNKPEELSNTSESAMFRLIDAESPTLLFDEVDNIFADQKANKALIGMLNAGYKVRGGKVIRCENFGDAIGRYNVYCPKAFTGIGKIPSTLQSRCIDIRLKRQPSDHKAEPFIEGETDQVGAEIADRIRASIQATVLGAVTYPPEITDGRMMGMAKPLLAIADAAGGEWPGNARSALVRIMRTGVEQSYGTRLLADCRKVFGYTDSALEEEMLNGLIKITTSPWAKWWEKDAKYSTRAALSKLADMLSPYGITPKDDSYERANFFDAWNTYLGDAELI